MKQLSLLFVLCLLLLASTCKKQDKLETELLGKTWLHSFEEDQADIIVYRPNTYDFAPSRGRTGFLLEKGGVAKQYDIAPTDGLEEHTGTWQLGDKNTIVVHLPGNGRPEQHYNLEIVSLQDEVLKVRKQPGLPQQKQP